MATKRASAKAKANRSKAAAKNASTRRTNGKTKSSEGSGKSWFRRGTAGFERKKQLDKAAQVRKEKGVPRFYLSYKQEINERSGKPSNEARIVFVDSDPFWVDEHNLKIDGRWGNFATCSKQFQSCPICTETNNKPVYTGYLTCIDTRKFRKDDGTVSKFRKVLFPMKGTAVNVLEKMMKANKGSLTGLVVDIVRMSKEEPNCGREFTKVGRINIAKKFGDESAKKHDYETILDLPGQDELTALGIAGAAPVGSDEDVAEVKEEDYDDLFED